MDQDQQAILLKKTSEILLGAHDFRDLAKNAVDLVVKQLKAQGLVGAGIFRVHQNENILSAYAYSARYTNIVDRLLPAKFSDLRISLAETKNLVVRTILTNQIQQSRNLADFSHGVVSEATTDKIQKLMRAKMGITFPIETRSGRVAGAILLALKEEKLSGEQLSLFETFASQLGLAFSNTFAFEKLMHQYQQKAESETDPDDEPSIKFTLRITPRQDKRLEQLAREKGTTKAELIREFLQKI